MRIILFLLQQGFAAKYGPVAKVFSAIFRSNDCGETLLVGGLRRFDAQTIILASQSMNDLDGLASSINIIGCTERPSSASCSAMR